MAAPKVTFSLLVVALFSSAPLPAAADTSLFNSFGPNSSFGDAGTFFGFDAGEEGDPSTVFARAFPFVPTLTGTVRSVELPLFYPCCSESPENGSLVVNLFASDGDLPGMLVESFTRTAPIEFEIAKFTSAVSPVLLAGHTYWLETTTTGDTAGTWFDAPGQVGPFRDVFRIDNGPWEVGRRDFSAAFRVNAEDAPVPEPSSMFLLGSGLAAAAVRRRWKKNRGSSDGQMR